MEEDIRKRRESFEKKAQELLEQLTPEEKVDLMSGSLTKRNVRNSILGRVKEHYNESPYAAGGKEEKGIPPLLFADGSRGVVCGTGKAVCFPVAALRAATFDPDLEEKIGQAIGEEVLAAGGNLFGGVCVNVPFHTGWGRSQETYGEDSFLIGEMGAALVRGITKTGVMACVKHLAFGTMENVRLKVNVRCDKRAEREVYLYPFERCIEAGAAAVMTAYNQYEGTYCGENEYLIREVLKGEWGFDGFVLNDFTWGIHDTERSVKAGLDVEMPTTHFYGEQLKDCLKEGRVKEEQIQESALRILRTLLAHQSIAQDYAKRFLKPDQAGSVFYNKKHIFLALECARKGITLLRNENDLLPLKPGKLKKSLVALGPLAYEEHTGDHGSSRVYPPYVVSHMEALRERTKDAEVTYYVGKNRSHCQRLAKEADYVLIFAGSGSLDEGEYVKPDEERTRRVTYGGDRSSISLKPEDLEIIKAVAEVRKDAIVILAGGGAFAIDGWDQEVGAILYEYYSGMEGANALADILFGKENPSGKLPYAFPRKEEDLPPINWEAEEQTYGYLHGYTYLEKHRREPAYLFGFGLSYTSFTLRDVTIEAGKEKQADKEKHRQEAEETEMILIRGSLQNTGKRDGEEVVQVYVGYQSDPCKGQEALPDDEPLRTLKGFTRVAVKKDCTEPFCVTIRKKDLRIYDDGWLLRPGTYCFWVRLGSQREEYLLKADL